MTGLALAMLLAATGCLSFSGSDGTTYHVILGLGVVRTKSAANAAASITDTRVLGVHASIGHENEFTAGYSGETAISVTPQAKDVRLEVSEKPWTPLRTTISSATTYDTTETRPDGIAHVNQ